MRIQWKMNKTLSKTVLVLLSHVKDAFNKNESLMNCSIVSVFPKHSGIFRPINSSSLKACMPSGKCRKYEPARNPLFPCYLYQINVFLASNPIHSKELLLLSKPFHRIKVKSSKLLAAFKIQRYSTRRNVS